MKARGAIVIMLLCARGHAAAHGSGFFESPQRGPQRALDGFVLLYGESRRTVGVSDTAAEARDLAICDLPQRAVAVRTLYTDGSPVVHVIIESGHQSL